MTRAWPLLFALVAASVGCDSRHRAHPTDWLELEHRRPWLDAPHALVLGRREDVVRVRLPDGWKEVARARYVEVTLLDGETALMNQFDAPSGPGVLERGNGHPRFLDARTCGEEVASSPDGRQIVCAACVRPRADTGDCRQAQVVAYDPRGFEVSRWRVAAPSTPWCGNLGRILFAPSSRPVVTFSCGDGCYFVTVGGTVTARRPECPQGGRGVADLGLAAPRRPIE